MTFEDWVGARGAALLRFALMISVDPGRAEDLVQIVLARAYSRWDHISGLSAPEAYLKTAIVNEHLKWWRRRSSREMPTDTTAVERPADGDLADRQARRDAGWALLARLPQRQRVVLALRYYEDMSDDAIAVSLGCSVNTVRSHAARGLAALRTVVPTLEKEVMP